MYRQYLPTLALVSIILYPLSACASDIKLDTAEKKASYSFGVDFAKRLQQQKVDLDIKALTRGIEDVTGGKELALKEEEMTTAKTSFQEKLMARIQKEQKEAGEKNIKEGKEFLAKNGKKEGIITTKSGLQYKIIKAGDGTKPKLEDTVSTHYRGTLIDGREFDSSYKRNAPATFPVTGVIKGWTEALQLMKVGAKWQLFIPSDLAYGDKARSELIQANSALLFELELLEIKGAKKPKEAKKK
jgi:FKBP-type peptidyl-prolyl cis-trans isomerase FklB